MRAFTGESSTLYRLRLRKTRFRFLLDLNPLGLIILRMTMIPTSSPAKSLNFR